MIYVKIEIWPGGNFNARRTLQEAVIWNHGGTATTGEYGYKLSKVGGFKVEPPNLCRVQVPAGRVLRQGEIGGFPRKRLYAHDLLYRIYRICFGDRNP